ncbi:MAG: Hpt domain-containing protein [Proteobacteria bacterium]|nr:Hpt domain-containing protein [Pseudomonadota bacterium]
MNFEKLAGEIGFDKEDYLELIELFINTTTGDIAKLKTAINTGDFNAAEKAAHSIKGAASSLGLTDISNEAKKIEHTAKGDPGTIAALSADELEAMLNRIRETYKTYKG